jgi:uncharacterized membrane protein YphA (DoxX/SURF4 family)
MSCTNGSSCCTNQYALLFAGLVVLVYFAVLFLQSGLDKVKDRQGNLAWLLGFFKDSPFRGKEGILLTILTILELLAGSLSLVGIPFLLIGNKMVGMAGISFAAISLLSVFTGQRLARDYNGSASSTAYLLFVLASLLLFISL